MIEETLETLGVSDSVARSLLINYQWNKEKLVQDYYDNEDLVKKVLKFDRF